MIPSLIQFAGFTCTEGQQSSNFKQFWITMMTIGLSALIIAAVHRRWPSKTLLVSLVIISVCISLAVAVFGPFFYSDWGCDFVLLELISGTSRY